MNLADPFPLPASSLLDATSPAFRARAAAWAEALRERGVKAAASTPAIVQAPYEPPKKVSTTPVAPRRAPSSPTYECPFLARHRAALDAAGDARIAFGDPADWRGLPRSAVALDAEVFPNFAVFCLKRLADGRRLAFELSARSALDRDGLREVLEGSLIVTFNGTAYDLPIAALALSGAGNAALFDASLRLVSGQVRPWDVERELGVRPLKVDHVDLMEPNPSVRQGLKTLAGRLHAPFVVDLPFDPHAVLSPREMNFATLYCMNDLDCTQLVAEALREPLALRSAMSREVGVDLRSKSDAQVGEAVVRRRIEKATGRKIGKPPSAPVSVSYRIPDFVSFSDNMICDIVARLAETEFRVAPDGSINLPDFLKGLTIKIGESTYRMGIGGLHSTEEHRALQSDDENLLIDMDVSSQYPNIIAKLGMNPPAAGPQFQMVYRALIAERIEAKRRQQELDKEISELERALKDG